MKPLPLPNDLFEALWPATRCQTVEWWVACGGVTITGTPSLAAAEEFALADNCGRTHTITLVKVDGATA